MVTESKAGGILQSSSVVNQALPIAMALGALLLLFGPPSSPVISSLHQRGGTGNDEVLNKLCAEELQEERRKQALAKRAAAHKKRMQLQKEMKHARVQKELQAKREAMVLEQRNKGWKPREKELDSEEEDGETEKDSGLKMNRDPEITTQMVAAKADANIQEDSEDYSSDSVWQFIFGRQRRKNMAAAESGNDKGGNMEIHDDGGDDYDDDDDDDDGSNDGDDDEDNDDGDTHGLEYQKQDQVEDERYEDEESKEDQKDAVKEDEVQYNMENDQNDGRDDTSFAGAFKALGLSSLTQEAVAQQYIDRVMQRVSDPEVRDEHQTKWGTFAKEQEKRLQPKAKVRQDRAI